MKKVLHIVQDEQINQVLKGTSTFYSNEYEFLFFNNFSEAENFINNNEDVVLVLTQFSSKFDGFSFIKKIQLTHPNIYRVLISDESVKSKIPFAINHVHKVLRFPFTSDELSNQLDYYLNLIKFDLTPELINKINGLGTVPVLPDIYIRLERELMKNEVSVSRVADVIGMDSFVTGQIMRVVYSSFYNISSNTLSVLHAINFLGLDIVKSLVLYIKVFSIKNVKPHTAEHLKKLRAHSIKVAKLSKAIMNFEVIDRELHDAAFTVGLLHDIGKILLIHFNDKHLVAQDFESDSDFNMIKNEKEYFGVDHVKAGSYLLHLWNFPKDLVEAIFTHHDSQVLQSEKFGLPQVVFIANSLVNNYTENIEAIKNVYGEQKLNDWKELIPNGELISNQS